MLIWWKLTELDHEQRDLTLERSIFLKQLISSSPPSGKVIAANAEHLKLNTAGQYTVLLVDSRTKKCGAGAPAHCAFPPSLVKSLQRIGNQMGYTHYAISPDAFCFLIPLVLDEYSESAVQERLTKVSSDIRRELLDEYPDSVIGIAAGSLANSLGETARSYQAAKIAMSVSLRVREGTQSGANPLKPASRQAESGANSLKPASRQAESGASSLKPASRQAETGANPLKPASWQAESGEDSLDCFYLNMGIYRFLFDNISETERAACIERYIAPLLQLDSQSNSELLKTLIVFLQNNRSNRKCSKQMYLHQNTIIYRLNKIKKICGLDFGKANDLLLIETAVKLYEIARILSDCPPVAPLA
jgi:sugar diacid utilization regulator